MSQEYIPPELASFDPAIFLHSEPAEEAPAESFSDDIIALQAQIEESTAQKTREGIVIQHRAWQTNEVFRSEEDHPIRTPTKNRTPRVDFKPYYEEPLDYRLICSSPPLLNKPKRAMSSPVALSSSPAKPDSPRKRRKVDERSPLKVVNGNARTVGGFLEVDTDDEEEEAPEYVHKTPKVAVAATPQVDVELDAELELTEAVVDIEPNKDAQPDSGVGEKSATCLDLPQSVSSQRAPSRAIMTVNTFKGRSVYVGERRPAARVSLEQIVAARSTTEPGRATKSHYGIDIHDLLEDLASEKSEADALKKVQEVTASVPTVEKTVQPKTGRKKANTMWTEKYRARKFTDLVGDERTHRSVLRWLKAWDSIVFPGSVKPKVKSNQFNDTEEKQHRKILLLTGPPGLGKTTLAHVCARQAGYEVQEINASDERSRDVVKGRIRDMVATENVRGVATAGGNGRKAGKPVCVIVDEVDGVVTGSSGGEGGFIKALMDLILLDQRNTNSSLTQTNGLKPKKKKGDNFRMLRPLILICNDVYHPSLRPLRQSNLAEIVHIRKPPLNMVISRVHSIFEKEGLPCDSDGVRRLCEATWGVSGRGGGTGGVEGDIRSVMVVGEWVAARFRSSADIGARLTKRWVEDNVLTDLSYGGGAARSLGRGGTREVVDRVFQHGAGFPASSGKVVQDPEAMGVIGVAEATKRRAINRLRDMIDTSGDVDRVLTDCFTSYPNQPIQDDNFLTKPNLAYDWLHFHDRLSSKVHTTQDWELAPYLSSTVLAFHNLFAASATARHTSGTDSKYGKEDVAATPAPFSGPSAPYTVSETLKTNNAAVANLQGNLSIPLARLYRSHSSIVTELLPYILRILAPDVKPVVINTSSGNKDGRNAPTASVRKAEEKEMVMRAVECMAATGVRFEKSKVEGEAGRSGGWVYRMEPGLDSLGAFETFNGSDAVVRFAVRQVLEGEWHRRRAGGGRTSVGHVEKHDEKNVDSAAEVAKIKEKVVKRDFFGRMVAVPVPSDANLGQVVKDTTSKGRVWVSFHEGYSNAVRKPITIKELMGAL